MVLFQVVDKFSDQFVKSALRLEKVKTDNLVFRLYYKLSVWLMVLYSLCFTYVLLKQPISCVGSDRKITPAMYNDYCWVHGTYSVIGKNGIYPGVAPVLPGEEEQVRYHDYYKWMYFFITFALIILHCPRQLWRSIESGRMTTIAKGLKCTVLFRDEEIEKEEMKLAEFLYLHLGYHGRYAYGFVLCEVLNLAVCGLLLFIWDSISNHQFSVFGSISLNFLITPPSHRTDPIAQVFPVMGKCIFQKYGHGGSIETHDVLCVLPLNIINERAAVFFWYFFVVLLAVGVGHFIFRLSVIISVRIRRCLLGSLSPLTPSEDMAFIVKNSSYSDWFMVYQVGNAIEPVVFRHILKKLVAKMRTKP